MLHLIRNAHIHAPDDLGLGHILVAAGRIVYIGDKVPELSTSLLQTDTDLEGRAIAPGLIDAHTHTTGGGGEAGYATRVPALPLSEFTRHGVTSVVGLLGTDDTVRNTSALVAQTYALREEGLSAWCYTGGYHFPLTTLTGSVRGDIVHVDCIIGVGELAISDHRSSQLQFEELIRVASDTHVAGLMTGKAGIVHLHLGDGERGLSMLERAIKETELPARVFNPTHVNRQKALFEEACGLARLGSHVDLTAFPADDNDNSWSASEAWQRYQEQQCPADKITISSDGGGCMPVFNEQGEVTSLDYARPKALVDCLQELLAAGHALSEVLPSLTRNPAQLLRLERKGQIVVGADADLVVPGEDGLFSDVMVNGEWHIQNQQIIRAGSFESR